MRPCFACHFLPVLLWVSSDLIRQFIWSAYGIRPDRMLRTVIFIHMVQQWEGALNHGVVLEDDTWIRYGVCPHVTVPSVILCWPERTKRSVSLSSKSTWLRKADNQYPSRLCILTIKLIKHNYCPNTWKLPQFFLPLYKNYNKWI